MRKLYLFLILALGLGPKAFSQAKLIAATNYNYIDSTASIVHSDSTAYYYKPTNTTSSPQNTEDAAVYATTADSVRQYSMQAAGFELQALWANTYNAAYTKTLTYVDTVFGGGGSPAFSNSRQSWLNANQDYDSIFSWQTVYPANTTRITMKQFMHYNPLNLIDTAWSVYFDLSGQYQSSYKQVSLYDASNRILQDFSYNSSDSVTYVPDTRIDHYYTAAGLTDSMVVFVWNSGAWQKAGRRTYTYNAGGKKTLVEYKGYDAMNLAYVNVSRDAYTRSNGTLPDTLYSQLWSTGLMKYDTTVKRGFIYSGNLLTHVYGYVYDALTSQWKPNPYGALTRYYYNVATSVQGIEPQKKSLTLYPVPAANELHVIGATEGDSYLILSASGQVQRSGVIEAGRRISLQGMNPGILWLIVDTEQGPVSRSFFKAEH